MSKQTTEQADVSVTTMSQMTPEERAAELSGTREWYDAVTTGTQREIDMLVATAIREAVEAERDACALVADRCIVAAFLSLESGNYTSASLQSAIKDFQSGYACRQSLAALSMPPTLPAEDTADDPHPSPPVR
jgi:hypothetical protein